jgi:hypothetical protein
MKTASEIAELLKQACQNHPEGQKGWAADHHFSAAFVGDVCRRKRDASQKLALALGFQRSMIFEPIKQKAS